VWPLTNTIRAAKNCLLGVVRATGLQAAILRSHWRQQRLCILCYHGVSLADEHRVPSGLFLRADQFRERLLMLRAVGFNFVELDEGLRRLREGTLPEASVAVTIDDGFYGAYLHGRPILQELKIPVTVYVTTYYVDYNRPVFDVMASYLMFHPSVRPFVWPDVFPMGFSLTRNGREHAVRLLREYAERRSLSGQGKDELLSAVADKLQLDYTDLCRRRIMHLMDRSEIKSWTEADVQLHTHHHRVGQTREEFTIEVQENRRILESVTGVTCRHFCFPNGLHSSEHGCWLRSLNVKSGVTCEERLASRADDPLLLPRVIDGGGSDLNALYAAAAGITQFIPRRAPPECEHVSRNVPQRKSGLSRG